MFVTANPTLTREREPNGVGRSGEPYEVDLTVSGDVTEERVAGCREVNVELDAETESVLIGKKERELAEKALADAYDEARKKEREADEDARQRHDEELEEERKARRGEAAYFASLAGEMGHG